MMKPAKIRVSDLRAAHKHRAPWGQKTAEGERD